ncbi:MAG: hypothetical protein M3Q19_13855 [Pseudomonadota bacterium]|nr:hypothetical protein [Pseudomonadota bacterium]
MAITISIDNNRSTVALDDVTHDENSGVQTQATADKGDEVAVAVSSGTVSGFTTVMNSILNAATIFGFANFALTAAQEAYLADVDGASSSLDFVKVTVTEGETIDDLFFSDADGNDLEGVQVVGMQTLDGEDIYLWSDGDLAIATTSATEGAGRLVAVFSLQEDADSLNAQIQMALLEQLEHPVDTDPDDKLDFTDVLNVSASGSISFDFDQLKSGSSLWVAVGNAAGGLLVTGGDPDVDAANKKTNDSDVIHTSQGGTGATIGVNNQLFDNVGETATFTLVKNLAALGTNPDAGATGDYTVDPLPNKKPIEGIDYNGYINTSGAGIFLSQSQGNDPKNLDIKLWEAGGDPGSPPQTDEDLTNYIPGLGNDTAVDVASVTITDDDGVVVGVWGVGGTLNSGDSVNDHASGNGTADVTVTFSGNTISVTGILGEYTVSWTSVDGQTFNRFDLIAQGGQFDVGRVDIDNVVGATEAVGDSLIVDDAGPALGNIVNSTVQFTTGATSGNVALLDVPRTDGQGSLEITDFTASFTILGKTIEGHINATNTEVKYFEDINNNNILDGSDVHWYTLSITEDGTGAGFYDFDVVNAPAAPPLTFNFDGLPSGQNLFGAVASTPSGPGLLFFGENPILKANGEFTNTSDTVNSSQGGVFGATIGVNNQMFDAGEGMYFTYVKDIADSIIANITGGLDQNEADDADNLDYAGGLNNTSAAFLGISQVVGSEVESMQLTAIHLDSALQERNLINGRGGDSADDVINITRVRVTDQFGVELEDTDGSSNLAGITIDLTGNTAVITGLEAGYIIHWETASDHNQVLVEGVGGKFDIGLFGINEPQQTPDHVLNFEVTLTDGDDDSAVDTFSINVDAPPFVI